MTGWYELTEPPHHLREVKEEAKNKTYNDCAVNLCCHNDKMYLITALPFPKLIIVIHFLHLDVVFMFTGHCKELKIFIKELKISKAACNVFIFFTELTQSGNQSRHPVTLVKLVCD